MVKVETKLNDEATKTLNKVTLKKALILIIIMDLFFFLLALWRFLEKDIFMSVIWLVVAIVFFPLFLILNKIGQKQLNKSMALISEDTMVTFIFEEEYMEIIQTRKDVFTSTTRAKYMSYVYSVIENEEAFIIYISKVQAHVVSKDKIVEGSVEELRSILSTKIGKNYKKTL